MVHVWVFAPFDAATDGLLLLDEVQPSIHFVLPHKQAFQKLPESVAVLLLGEGVDQRVAAGVEGELQARDLLQHTHVSHPVGVVVEPEYEEHVERNREHQERQESHSHNYDEAHDHLHGDLSVKVGRVSSAALAAGQFQFGHESVASAAPIGCRLGLSILIGRLAL